MARKITTGEVGGAPGGINITNTTLSAANNLDISIVPQGTGILSVNGDTLFSTQSDIRFGDADDSNYVAFQAPATIASNVTWTLPASDAATSGYALASNGAGVLSWQAVGPEHDDETATATTYYPVITTQTAAGFLTTSRVSSSKLSYQPSTGTLTSTVLNETSSITLKENFSPIEDALDKILELSGWIYDRKDGSSKNEAGLVAEEVEKVIPNIVTKNNQGNPESIAYTRLTAYLVEAVKTLKAEIDGIKGGR